MASTTYQLAALVLLLNSNTAVIGGNRSTIYSPRAPVKYYVSSTL